MVDSLHWAQPAARSSTILERLGLESGADGFALATLHRPENVDSRDKLGGLLTALTRLAADLPVVFPAHPRTRARLQEFGLASSLQPLEGNGHRAGRGQIRLLEPLGYVDCLRLLGEARLVLTDSGGVQEETTCLGVPCVTLRETTERPITTRLGTSVLAGTDPERVLRHARDALAQGRRRVTPPPLWDGRASERIVERLIEQWCTGEWPFPRRG
jgi:UDP-N-acetylglucosamine 2-epimerase (non-hydrolysing)